MAVVVFSIRINHCDLEDQLGCENDWDMLLHSKVICSQIYEGGFFGGGVCLVLCSLYCSVGTWSEHETFKI